MDTVHLNDKKRAVLYARVSTDEQAKGYSLITQLDECQKYAESNGFVIVGTFKDDYSGATPIELRPAGRKAYELLSRGEADALIVYRMDRLVRPPDEGDEWDIPILIRGLAKVGREIHSVDRGKLETSFAGLLIAVLDGKSAGDERRKITERSMRGRRAKAKEKWVGTSYAPFGYRKIGKGRETYLEIDEARAAIVRRIFAIYLGVNGEQRLGFDNIAQLFNDEGVTHPGHSKITARWHSSSIAVIISNRVYIGQLNYGSETIEIPQLAIIDRTTFDHAQQQRTKNLIESKRNVRHYYLLRSRLKCTCDRKMSCMWIHNNNKDYQYYQCNRKAFDSSQTCDRLKVRTDAADQVTWRWLVRLFENPDRMQSGLSEYARRQHETLEPKRKRLAVVEKLLGDTEKQANQLTDSLQRVKGKKAKLAIQTIERQLEQISTAHQRYLDERERLRADLENEDMGEAQQLEIMGWATEIRQGIADNDVRFETKRALIERLQVTAKIEYRQDERGLRLTCVLAYAEKWESIAVWKQSLSSDSSFHPQVRSIS